MAVSEGQDRDDGMSRGALWIVGLGLLVLTGVLGWMLANPSIDEQLDDASAVRSTAPAAAAVPHSNDPVASRPAATVQAEPERRFAPSSAAGTTTAASSVTPRSSASSARPAPSSNQPRVTTDRRTAAAKATQKTDSAAEVALAAKNRARLLADRIAHLKRAAAAAKSAGNAQRAELLQRRLKALTDMR